MKKMKEKIVLSLAMLVLCISTGYAQFNQYYSKTNSINISNKLCYSKSDSLVAQNAIVSDFNNLIDVYISDGWYILSSPARLDQKSAYKLSAVLIMGGMLYAFDQEILDGFRRSWENPVYSFISQTGAYFEPMGQIEKMNPYCLAGYTIGYIFKADKLQEASIQIIESLSIAAGYKQIIRRVVGRTRPSEHLGANYFKFNTGESFPSGHTSNAFQVATILSYHINYLPFTVVSYGIAASIGLWRIDQNLHWASDVFLGAIYGTVVSSALLKFHEKRKLKLTPKLFQGDNAIGFNMTYEF